MCPSEDRFYVKESAGYPINVKVNNGIGSSGGVRRESVEILVLDRAYCHRVVWSSWAEFGHRNANNPRRLAKARAEAASQWSAEDRADAA